MIVHYKSIRCLVQDRRQNRGTKMGINIEPKTFRFFKQFPFGRNRDYNLKRYRLEQLVIQMTSFDDAPKVNQSVSLVFTIF